MRRVVRRAAVGHVPRPHVCGFSTLTLAKAKEVLELSPSKFASTDDVKSAYRRLALHLHPDKSREAGSSERFRELQQGYEVALEAAKYGESMHPKTIFPKYRKDVSSMENRKNNAQETMKDFVRNPEAFMQAQARARAYDDAMRQKFEASTEAHYRMASAESNISYQKRELRGGWVEETWQSKRATAETGFKEITSTRLRITEPKNQYNRGFVSGGFFGESEYEEWIGYNGVKRRKTHKHLPSRFNLAQKTFGQTPFSSMEERRCAIEMFGSPPVIFKVACSYLPF